MNMATSWYRSLFYPAVLINKFIMVSILIYLAATWYQFLFLSVILMILRYLAMPLFTAQAAFVWYITYFSQKCKKLLYVLAI